MIPAYELQNITYSYGKAPFLEVNSMRIASGEMVALVGPNGSGKTTLLHLLAFIEQPHTGCINFFGEEFKADKKIKFRRQVGLLLQNPYLFRGTVLSNLVWGLRLRGVSSIKAEKSAVQALHLVGLMGFESRPAGSLSGGESQRVALARSLALEPRVLLLDEPSNHMDKNSVERTEEVVIGLNQEKGTTVILTTHAVDKVKETASRFLHMRHGKVFTAAPDNLFEGHLQDNGTVFYTGRLKIKLDSTHQSGGHMAIDAKLIEVYLEHPKQRFQNILRGKIVALTLENDQINVDVQTDERLRVVLPKDRFKTGSELTLGTELFLILPPNSIAVF